MKSYKTLTDDAERFDADHSDVSNMPDDDQTQPENSRDEDNTQSDNKSGSLSSNREDTNRIDDVDEEDEYDEVNEYAEVDDTDEEDALDGIVEEPLLYRAAFSAQDLSVANFDYADDDDQDDSDLFGYDALDDFLNNAVVLDAKSHDQSEFQAAVVSGMDFLDLTDLSDPLAAIRWFNSEDVFDENDSGEWFTP